MFSMKMLSQVLSEKTSRLCELSANLQDIAGDIHNACGTVTPR